MRGGRLRSVTVPAVLASVAAAAVGGPALAHGGGQYQLDAWGRFGTAGERGVPAAVTYEAALVPRGAKVAVRQRIAGEGMSVELRATGLRPGHTYGTHVHTDPCGADPEDSGPHYQHRTGDDPALANPDNEVWLDFTADEDGEGEASVWQPWTFRPGEARSVVLHEEATSTGEDGREPGDAGARVGCLTVPFVAAAEAEGAGKPDGSRRPGAS